MTRKKPNRKKSLATRAILWLNLVFVVPFLVSYISPVVHPEITVVPALASLFYPILLIINFAFLLFWIFRFRMYFLISLVAILGGYNLFFKTFAFNRDKPVGDPGEALKLVSYNVRLFDQYKWTGGQNYFTRNSVFEFASNQEAGVVCFQEFFHGTDQTFPTIEPFIEKSGIRNYHVDYVLVKGDDEKHYGLATFTRFPIVNKGSIHFDGSSANSGIYTDILFNEDTIRIFNFHLESVKLSQADHRFVSEFIDPGTAPKSSSPGVIIKKLSNAIKRRAKQADKVAGIISESPHPVIVCGDFNDTPLSYVYRKISKDLKDAFIEIGRGVGETYAGGIPFLRIDYILHSEALEAFDFEKHPVTLSDHYPITCYFKLK